MLYISSGHGDILHSCGLSEMTSAVQDDSFKLCPCFQLSSPVVPLLLLHLLQDWLLLPRPPSNQQSSACYLMAVKLHFRAFWPFVCHTPGFSV
ncbi:hypothetical protein CHARACLAT_019658 [Characodon lateralis]|uniref:Uncharacterized protein n=1 Tax=Characodon lateralis TaxID=208331 RepID=A0ABU7ELX4_9TELE|nr:hypothetical protein [Characodon lateralis]